MNKSPQLLAVFIILLSAANIFAQWKLAASNVIQPIFRPFNGGGVLTHHNGILWAGYKDIWVSKDTGKTWSKRTPFNTFNNSCIKDINFYDDNIGLATTQNAEVFVTLDQGLSWTRHVPPNPFLPSIESGCFAGSPSNIIACSNAGDVYSSGDGGVTWTIFSIDSVAFDLQAGKGGNVYLISGTSVGSKLWESRQFGAAWVTLLGLFNPDSYSFVRDECDTSLFYVANDNLASRANTTSGIFLSSNTGQTWQPMDQHPKPYHCGSITAAPNAVFVQTYSGIRRSTDQGQTWKDIGGPPNIKDTRFITAIDNNIIAAVDSFGSVWITSNSGGDSLSVIDGSLLSLQTTDQKTDTLGGTVSVPFSLNGLNGPQDFDIIMHYDTAMIYQGTYSSANVKLDVSSESWKGRSKIHFQGANSSGILAYSFFNVFSDSAKKPLVTFDSLMMLSAIIACNNAVPSKVVSVISPVSGCSTDILTHFMLDSTTPQLFLNPNPTTGEISISSTQDLGEVRISIYDILGEKRSESTVILKKETPAKIILPPLNGVYSITVSSAKTTYTLRAVFDR